ncbi:MULTISPECIES: winged helix-turn-helix domain-containing protein [Pandoraea]|uniref:winged helix-turn-helix domain-containing protein n=1 Tax=Pandoraea TaxID=93217 RepID=UPI001F5E0FDB|nr:MULTISPECIES: winged helix-turn-helix domain-containing protein [Pandoraea]MCI3205538.1 hypothetical protein [Pandoraea sp. LA3]MDN4583566.1 hypothetical protein [Pandoraea capi]
MVKFLIGDIAGFDTDTFTLVSQHDASLSVPLGAAAGRCLQVLLEAEGEIVTKRNLLTQGWEQYGAVVSDNNLSQSIVRIRRGLQQLGVDPTVLATLPRIGYRLTNAKRISPFVDALTSAPLRPENGPAIAASPWDNAQIVGISEATSNDGSNSAQTPVSPNASSLTTHPASAPSVAISLRNVEPHDASPNADRKPVGETAPASSNAVATPAAHPQWRPGWSTASVWSGVAIVSAILAGWGLPSLRGDLRTNASIAQWTPLEDAPDNRVFIAPDFKQDTDFVKQRLARLASTPPLSIGDAHERYVYINGSGGLDVFSYFLCREPIGRANSDCLSYLLIDHTNS